MGGAFNNSSFTVFSPDGETKITGSGRQPAQGLLGRKKGSLDEVVGKMKEISATYPSSAASDGAVLPDFHTFRQALNIASSDQRLLLHVVAPSGKTDPGLRSLQLAMNAPEIVGKFHLNFRNNESDQAWSKAVANAEDVPGYYVIRPDTFGQTGKLAARLPLSASTEEIKKTLLEANQHYASQETRKSYVSHVSEGREKEIHFEQPIPFGEDRDGDGLIDNPRARRAAEMRRDSE